MRQTRLLVLIVPRVLHHPSWAYFARANIIQNLLRQAAGICAQRCCFRKMVETRPSTSPGFHIVVAHDRARGIGKQGRMPWNLPKDMAYFKCLTSTPRTPGNMNAVIMGRATWESIPPNFKPLRHRINIVISRYVCNRAAALFLLSTSSIPDDSGLCRTLVPGDHAVTNAPQHIASDLESALTLAAEQNNIDTVFVIGGGMVYEQAIRHPTCEALHVTDIQAHFECDTFFPLYPNCFTLWSAGNTVRCGDHRIAFKLYTRCALSSLWPCTDERQIS